MEPAFVEPLTEEQLNSVSEDEEGNIDDNVKNTVVHKNVLNAVGQLRLGIFAFKKKMFYHIVSNDKAHSPGDIGSMITFHSLFLQALSYWIGLLDSKPVPPPSLPKPLVKDFKVLTTAIEKVYQEDSDSRVLVYDMLFTLLTLHPYNLGPHTKSEDDD